MVSIDEQRTGLVYAKLIDSNEVNAGNLRADVKNLINKYGNLIV
jgi:hypothetical protein